MKQLLSSISAGTGRIGSHYLWLSVSILVAVGYLLGLGGDHIPRNGDELVYANIARLTAESGSWLPLVSAWDFMRNTKPPVLFWQAMVAGDWGQSWELLNLRIPSLLYTWAVALMVGLLTWRVVLNAENPDPRPLPEEKSDRAAVVAKRNPHAMTTGAIAALVYLSFFTTYRYGRPYLTSAPETFWLFGVFFAIAWSPVNVLASRWKFAGLAGVALGIGCLYKSFAMVVPVGFGLALCYQTLLARKAPWQIFRRGMVADAVTVAAACLLALAVFGLWFAVDPQPGEVWREFVVGENAGKFKSSPGYWAVALSSHGFITILTGYFTNAAFLLPLAVGCMLAAWKSWCQKVAVSDNEKVMWLWLLALMLVFLLPNQRSTRYLIPAMPALAVIIALYWSRISRIWFSLSLMLCLLGVLAMGWIGYGAVTATGSSSIYSPLFWVYLASTVLACGVGIAKPAFTRPLSAVAGFSVFFALAWATVPFNGELGSFKPSTLALLKGQRLAVPSNFNGHFERYTFITPGAKIEDYFAAQPVDFEGVDDLLNKTPYALVQRRIGDKPCNDCRVIDERWDLRSRQSEKEGSMGAFKSPQTFWFAKEYLVEKVAP